MSCVGMLSIPHTLTAIIMVVTLRRYTYRRGLQRCSSLTDWAMPEPHGVGRAKGRIPTLFVYVPLSSCIIYCLYMECQDNKLSKGRLNLVQTNSLYV